MNYEFYQVCGLRCLFELSRWCMSSIRYGVCAVYLSSQDDLWTLPGIKFALFIHTLKMIYEFYQVWRLRCSFTLSRLSMSAIRYGICAVYSHSQDDLLYEFYQVWCLRYYCNLHSQDDLLYELYQVWHLHCLFALSRWSMSYIRFGICIVYSHSQGDLWIL